MIASFVSIRQFSAESLPFFRGIYLSFLLSFPFILFSQTLQITEFMASNGQTLADEDGEFSDWIEIHNPTTSPINLSGWHISDNKDDFTKWTFVEKFIAANDYLVIFASGKNRKTGTLHTNFKLSSSGERLILTMPDGETIADETEGKFPQQYTDISYALINETWSYADLATPGAANATEVQLTKAQFSEERGFFQEEFKLTLQSPTQNSQIIYTLDGSQPSETHGTTYSAPISIDSTIIVRAIAVKQGYSPSRITTHSYIFLSSVINQSDTPIGYPDNWGNFSTIDGLAPADYEMDPEITKSDSYKDRIIPALQALPTISLVTNKEFLFSSSTDPDSGGIYVHTNPPTGGLGIGWERPVSFEYFPLNDDKSIQIDAGIRIHGGHSRVPEKSPKHSFRIAFRGEYGQKKLDYDFFGEGANQIFNNLVLRAGFNQTWLHWTSSQRQAAQYINDSWVKNTYRKMGHLSAHHQFTHLYINGLYWGVYDISERMDQDFMEAYLEGKADDFDVIKDYAELVSGEEDAWDEMMDMAEAPTRFMEIQGKNEAGENDPLLPNYLNAEALIDYMILNFYIGNRDWDHHNWAAVRNRENPNKGFQFLPWDSERSFFGLSHDETNENNYHRPSYLYSQFRKDLKFRELFAQRVNALLGPQGLLSPDSVAASWEALSSQIALAIVAESARWGDYRRDKHPYKSGDYELYTKDEHWDKEQDDLFNDYFPYRTEIVYRQLLAGSLAKDPRESLSEHGVFPNPIMDISAIYYDLPSSSHVEIRVFDLQGRLVENIFSGEQVEGLHQIYWAPQINNGMYIYRIQTEGEIWTGKVKLSR